ATLAPNLPVHYPAQQQSTSQPALKIQQEPPVVERLKLKILKHNGRYRVVNDAEASKEPKPARQAVASCGANNGASSESQVMPSVEEPHSPDPENFLKFSC